MSFPFFSNRKPEISNKIGISPVLTGKITPDHIEVMKVSPIKVVVVGGVRTPFARIGRELKDFHPADLAFQNLRELTLRSNVPREEIDEVIMGNVANLPDAANVARVAALRADLLQVPAFTVHRNCASSLESIVTGTAKIQAGQVRTVIAGGVESLSQAPFLFPHAFQEFALQIHRGGFLKKIKSAFSFRLKFLKPRSALKEALTDPVTGLNMGQTAEILAREFHITRALQDEYALESHRRATVAENKLREELFPLFCGPEQEIIDGDRGVRGFPDEKKMKELPPYFEKYGTVTAGNSCSMSDGSSLVILMEEQRAGELGLKPLSRVRSLAFCGLEPERMGLGPAYAIPKALSRAGLSLKNIGLIEINEAFSAQVLACLKALESPQFAKEKLNLSKAVGEVNPARLNVNGGAIALGHPVSATGSRLVLTLSKEMKRRGVQFGLVSLCVGGGQGGALVLENVS